jgi:hypothetical protein
MKELDIFLLFIFVMSVLYASNVIIKIITNVLDEEPKRVFYNLWEKISNYLFFTYLITYLIVKFT